MTKEATSVDLYKPRQEEFFDLEDGVGEYVLITN